MKKEDLGWVSHERESVWGLIVSLGEKGEWRETTVLGTRMIVDQEQKRWVEMGFEVQ
jgi:hypothetical protein